MDHVIDAMYSHYEVYLDLFIEEHRKNGHKKLSDNVYYDEVKALIDAVNILRKHLSWETIKLSEEVSWRLEG